MESPTATQASDENGESVPEMSKDQFSAVKEMAKSLFGDVHAQELAPAYADEQLRKSAGVPHHLWNDSELYNYDIRGKLAAIEIIHNQIQTVERYYEIMKRNLQKASQQTKTKNQRRNKPKPRPAKRTRRYRRR